MSKNVGERFKLLVDRSQEQRRKLFDVARMTTLAENELWTIWRKNDPITAAKLVEGRKHKEEHGKWPKTDAYFLGECKDGKSATKIAKVLCPAVHSGIYDAIANYVRRLYPKFRWEFLTYQRRLPISKNLRIRFRESVVAVRRDPANELWFQCGVTFAPGNVEWFAMRTSGVSESTRRWLNELADTGEHPSGGCISHRERRGKHEWQISLARARYPGEVDQIRRPVDGRSLVVWAPLEQDAFLKMQVFPQRGRPWVSIVESDDLYYAKRRYERQRETMGRNYAQSPNIKGRGRKRLMRSRHSFADRWERRTKDWIENRSAAIVREALDKKCPVIWFENLSGRDATKLRLGTFPYDRILTRTKAKALDAGLEFEEFDDFETFTKKLAG